MKKSVIFLFIAILTAMLSGCILSKSPSTASVVVLPGTQQTFKVIVFPFGGTYAWTLDGAPLANVNSTYQYTPTIGEHTLIVTATHILGTDKQTWTVTDAEAAKTIDSTGGTVTVTAPASPLAGAQVEIPAGALSATVTITISQVTSPAGLPGQPAGPCVDFGPDGTQFSAPVKLTLPYADADNDGIVDGTGVSEDKVKAYYFNETSSAWDEVPVIDRDPVNNLVSIQATHFSCYSTSISYPTWKKIWGGIYFDMLMGVHQTPDGGYLCGGSITKTSGDVLGVTVNGQYDLYVTKLNSVGEILWQRTYGGNGTEGPGFLGFGGNILTSDGGLVIGSSSESTDIPGSPHHGGSGSDAYIVRTDSNGETVWQHLVGGAGTDGISSIDACGDGGFIMAGSSSSTDIPGTLNNGGIDCYVIKLNSQGVVEWQKLYGGPDDDRGVSIRRTQDGGSILLMYTFNPSGYRILKLDANGGVEWEKVLATNFLDTLSGRILQSTDGGYVFVGEADNGNTSYFDVVKMDKDGVNEWEYTLSHAAGTAVSQTSDGGYVVTGEIFNGWVAPIIVVVKLDEFGKEQWVRYPFQGCWFFSIEETADNGYILGGFTYDGGHTMDTSFAVMKLDSTGNLQLSDPIIGLLNSLVSIPGGTFMMGSTDDEYGLAQYTTPVHEVTLQGYEMGAYEVTQAQYLAVMGTNYSNFQGPGTENNPVDYVTWHEARAFCAILSSLTSRTFTLPSEAQWEYACRAGTTTLYNFGDADELLGDYAWYGANSNGTTHPVGTKLPNDWGLYDMHGNVWEWCLDSWHLDYTGAPTDGSAWEPETGYYWGVRGGSWAYDPWYCRSASRNNYYSPGSGDSGIGFRIVEIP